MIKNEYTHFSICENPSEIDARAIYTKYDWIYSNSLLINNYEVPYWNIGLSKYG